jgi:NADH dehydrogenase
MVFKPMFPEVVGASISPRHVVNPLRLLCPRVSVFTGKVEPIDLNKRQLVADAGAFAGKTRFRYKDLVLALGAKVDLSRFPGMPEHAYLIQNIGDAMLLRTTIISRTEEANLETRPEVRRRLLSFVVVGGGYSGVETAGQILDLFRAIRRYYPRIKRRNIHVSLIHSCDHILPTLSRSLGQYAGDKLRQRGLDLRLNQRVCAVTASYVQLDGGSRIETHTVISTIGNAPTP